jgi:hypothetical protein
MCRTACASSARRRGSRCGSRSRARRGRRRGGGAGRGPTHSQARHSRRASAGPRASDRLAARHRRGSATSAPQRRSPLESARATERGAPLEPLPPDRAGIHAACRSARSSIREPGTCGVAPLPWPWSMTAGGQSRTGGPTATSTLVGWDSILLSSVRVSRVRVRARVAGSKTPPPSAPHTLFALEAAQRQQNWKIISRSCEYLFCRTLACGMLPDPSGNYTPNRVGGLG